MRPTIVDHNSTHRTIGFIFTKPGEWLRFKDCLSGPEAWHYQWLGIKTPNRVVLRGDLGPIPKDRLPPSLFEVMVPELEVEGTVGSSSLSVICSRPPDFFTRRRSETPLILPISYFRIISERHRSGDEDESTFGADLLLRQKLQLQADSRRLIRPVDGQVRQVAAIMKIRHAARDTDQLAVLPRGDHQIAIPEHALDACEIIDRPSVRQPGPPQDREKLLDVDVFVDEIIDIHKVS